MKTKLVKIKSFSDCSFKNTGESVSINCSDQDDQALEIQFLPTQSLTVAASLHKAGSLAVNRNKQGLPKEREQGQVFLPQTVAVGRTDNHDTVVVSVDNNLVSQSNYLLSKDQALKLCYELSEYLKQFPEKLQTH